jgi:hypothetical protein
MKTMQFVGAVLGAIFVLCGCASTYDRESNHNTRWVVVSTNEPVSSDLVGRSRDYDEAPRPPLHAPSVLLAPENQEARQEVENSNLSPALKKKLLDGEVLTLADIEDLGRNKIGEATILKHLRGTRAVYVLRTDDINRLQEAGLSKGVIDYMLSTVNQPDVKVVRKQYHHYYYDPWWDYHWHHPFYYRHYHYYPSYRHHHGGGGLRVYRGSPRR